MNAQALGGSYVGAGAALLLQRDAGPLLRSLSYPGCTQKNSHCQQQIEWESSGGTDQF